MSRDPRPALLLPILSFALMVACTHSPPSTAPLAIAPCRVAAVGPVDSSWRQVRASGFTFCIPSTWRASGPASDTLDPKGWAGPEGSVTWGLGRPPSIYPPGPTAEATMSVVRVPAGTIPNPVPAGTLPNPSVSPGTVKRLCPDPITTPISIDSVEVVVTSTACRGLWKTTAWSTTPSMYVQGEAHSAERAKLLNAIIVTIRFGSGNR
jgi:hypothetical protein